MLLGGANRGLQDWIETQPVSTRVVWSSKKQAKAR
jgi:hypothetical protein